MDDPLRAPATPARLAALAAAGLLDPHSLEEALLRSGGRAAPSSWLPFLRARLLLVGVVLLAVGVVFFFAANWHGLLPLTRLALLATGLVLATGLALHVGLDPLGGRVAVLLAALLLGPLLAVYGQTYQTGADAYGLFLAWGLLCTGFAVVARFAGLWLLWLALLELSLGLYWAQVHGAPALLEVPASASALALSGLALLAWEVARGRGVALCRARWPARMVIAVVVVVVTLPLLVRITSHKPEGDDLWRVALYLGAVLALAWGFLWRRHDLFAAATLGLSLAVVLGWYLNVVLFHAIDGVATVFLVGLFALAESSLLGFGLKALHHRWRDDD